MSSGPEDAARMPQLPPSSSRWTVVGRAAECVQSADGMHQRVQVGWIGREVGKGRLPVPTRSHGLAFFTIISPTFYTLRPPPPPCASLPSCHPSFFSLLVLLVLLVLLLSASATGPALPPPRPGSGQLQLRPALMTARHDVACIRSGSSIARTRQREARHLEESASRENHHRHT